MADALSRRNYFVFDTHWWGQKICCYYPLILLFLVIYKGLYAHG